MQERKLEDKLAELIKEREEIQNKMDNFELDPDDYEDQYCDFLDEVGEVRIGDLTYSPSMVLREVDPTAYRCGLIDYVDSFDKEDTKEYKELEDSLESLNSEIEDMESLINEEAE